jgi:hypothetical protein
MNGDQSYEHPLLNVLRFSPATREFYGPETFSVHTLHFFDFDLQFYNATSIQFLICFNAPT